MSSSLRSSRPHPQGSDVTTFLQQLVNGLAVGSIYVLIALGVTLVFGLTRLINFAHGEFLAVGALITAALIGAGWGFWVSAVVAVAFTTGVAAIIERVVFRPTLDVPINGFIVSLGVIAVSQGVMVNFFGVEPRRASAPVSGVATLGSAVLPYDRLLVIAVTVLLLVALFFALERSDAGRRVRATTEDAYAASLVGINVVGTVALTFAVGSALAAIAGTFMATIFVVTPFSGLHFAIKGFITAIVGGLGNVRGAAIAGVLLGLVETMGAAYVSARWQDGFGYLLLVAILTLRPQGLLRGTSHAAA